MSSSAWDAHPTASAKDGTTESAMRNMQAPGLVCRYDSPHPRQLAGYAVYRFSATLCNVPRSEHDDLLADRSIVLHVVVRSPDLVERVRLHRTEAPPSRRDPIEISLEHIGRQIRALPSVRRQPHAIRDVADRIELL